MNNKFKAIDPNDGQEHEYTITTSKEHSQVDDDLPCIVDENGKIPYRRQKTIIRNKYGKRTTSTGEECITHAYIRWLLEFLNR